MAIHSFTRKWVAILLLIVGLWLYGDAPAVAQAQASPQACRLGTYVLGLRDFDLAQESFSSDFWLWAVCPSKDQKPLETMEFIDAKDLKVAYDTVLERKDPFQLAVSPAEKKDQLAVSPAEKKVYWSQRKVSAKFYHNWDVRNFPFDRHTLEIPMEEAESDTTQFAYIPDQANSQYKPDIKLEGWKITSFGIREEKTLYNTTFGDPELKTGQSVYSRAIVSIGIQRQSVISFLKLTAVVYIGFILSLASYFLNPVQTSLMGAKISASVGSLFAVVVNQRATESVLGRTDGLTLVDQIHITAMAYILIAVMIAVYSRVIGEQGDEKWAVRLNHLSAFIAGVSFLIINTILISHAAISG